jgi:ArpU family phage transcriptional regulator
VEQVYEEFKLTSVIRRKAEKILSSYRYIDAQIENLKYDLPQIKLTPSYELRESSSNGEVSNTIESMYIKIEDIEERLQEKTRIKRKLDILHNELHDRQKHIWEKRYIFGFFDDDVINDLKISRRQYYREKNELLSLVAEAFYLI